MTQALAPPSSSRSAQRTVVAVIGTTGVGKSDLAVALARSLLPSGRGQVLSADSMQLYKGLDVITNKMTTEEMQGVRHWGLDLVTPGQGSWEVGRWCSEADKQMSEMDGRTLPIVCGGTHYFIQHFLFPPESLSFERGSTTSAPRRWEPPHPQPRIPGDMDPELRRLLDTFWTERPVWPGEAEEAGPSTHASNLSAEAKDQRLLSLHRLLAAVDPGEAGRWHWRDGRKVRRGLERWWEKNGEGPQDTQDGESGEAGSKGRQARFRTLIFWVYEPLETLRPRLSRRVDKMVENGLLREIAELRGIAERLYGSTKATDHSEGIFQSIGYKEFADLNLEQEDPSADPAFGPMLERMKLSTHQYAKSQIKWIRKQLLPAVKEARSLGGNVEVYVVHGGEAGHEPAIKLLNSFLSSEQIPSWAEVGHPDAGELLAELGDPEGSRVPDTAERQQINQRRDCEICSTPGNPLSISVKDWDVHVKSRSHRGKVTILNAGGIDGWIEQQRSKGVAKKLERQALKAGSALDPPDSHTIPDT